MESSQVLTYVPHKENKNSEHLTFLPLCNLPIFFAAACLLYRQVMLVITVIAIPAIVWE